MTLGTEVGTLRTEAGALRTEDGALRTEDGAAPSREETRPEPGSRRGRRVVWSATAPRAHTSQSSVWAGRLAVVAMVAGAAVRLEQFGSRRSLWLDEALVANNIVGRSFGGLVHPLAGQQGAPIGWLWAQRLMVVVFGDNEYALRLVPLMAGIAALVLLHRVALRVVGPWPAALATCLLASAPSALRYSVEVKQYSSDLAWGLVLTLLALRAAARPIHRSGRSPWPLAAWGAIGAVAVWCSHPAVLVLAAGAAVLFVAAVDRRRPHDVGAVVVASVPWVVSFGVDWLVSLRRLGGNSYLRSYWAAGFAPKPFMPVSAGSWAVHATIRLMSDPGALPAAGLAAVIVVAGLVRAIARRPVEGALVTAPLAVGIGAGAVGAYPLDGRIALWVLPVLLLGLASAAAGLAVWADTTAGRATGIERAAHLRRPRGLPDGGVVVALCCVAALVQAPARQVGSLAHDPAIWVDLRPMLQQIHDRAQPGDQVWVHDNDAPSAAFYARATGVDPDGVVSATVPGTSCRAPGEPARLAAGGRVWFVYGYRASNAPPGEPATIVARLAASARVVTELQRPGVSAWLLDFSAPPPAEPSADRGRLACVSVTPVPPPQPTGLSTGPFGTGRSV